jgi:comEA protein
MKQTMMDLTPSEKRTIFIISGVLILAGLFYIYKSYSEKPDIIDYSESDSIFSRLTHTPILQPEKGNINTFETNVTHEITNETSKSAAKIEKGSIDINRANKNELEKLPRIGPAMANKIIEYRNTKGPFKSIDDLTNVKGIGKKTLILIKPYLRDIQ